VLTNKQEGKKDKKIMSKFHVSLVSGLITAPSSMGALIGSLLPDFIFFTSLLEQMKIRLTMLQNSLQDISTNL
jgi:hypothetical protein